ncbi:unnamed protein product [Effrenium voratum]|uniref:Uncharacterized protein n=1 Tax=Effrenium voratum TaxID=2562239 RepID=A0AA36J2W2_9DINO|nr:unnamed protein product [Effrenium voratum]
MDSPTSPSHGVITPQFSAEVDDSLVRGVAANKRISEGCRPTKGTYLHTLQTAQKTRNVAIHDKFLATAEKNGIGEIFDLSKKSQVCTLSKGGKISQTMYNVDISATHVILSSARPFSMTCDEKDKRLQVANVFDYQGTYVHSLQHGAMIGRGGICLSPEYAATSGEDQVVKVWSLETGKLLGQVAVDKARSPGVRIVQGQLLLSGISEVSIYSLPGLVLERRLVNEMDKDKVPTRATPQTYPRLAMGGPYVVSGSETRTASVWTLADGKLLCTISDERRISGDFMVALSGDKLVVIAGKMLKIYDLTVHAGYRRAISESLGMSLEYLIEPSMFTLTAQTAAGKEDPNFHELAPAIAYGPKALGAAAICPRDGRPGCALVDVLPAGPATHFLSWAWGYHLTTVVLALRHWCQECQVDAAQTFIWICFFCNNQERILNEKSQEGSDDLETTFQGRLKAIGQVLVLFDDWSKPAYLTRVWCIFETFVAVRSDISYSLIFPPESSKSLHATLQRGMHLEVTKDWSSIDVAQAKASRMVDEEKVKGLITRTSSFDEVNSVVKSHLVNWFKRQFEVVFEKGVQEGVKEAHCLKCMVKDEEIATLKAMLEERDAEIARLRELLPAGSGAQAAQAVRLASPRV